MSIQEKVHLWAYELPYHGILVRFAIQGTCFLLLALTPFRSQLVTPITRAHSVPRNMSCHAGCYCSSQCSQLGETVDYCSSPTSYLAPFRTMRASQQARTSLYCLISHCTVPNNVVCLGRGFYDQVLNWSLCREQVSVKCSGINETTKNHTDSRKAQGTWWKTVWKDAKSHRNSVFQT